MKWLHNALLILPLPLLAACSALPNPVTYDRESFRGMSALVGSETSRRPLHVLIVHGIGTPAPYQFEGFIASLAGRFGLVQVPPPATAPQTSRCYPATPAQQALIHPAPQVIAIDSVPEDAQARLYTYSFAPHPEEPPALTVSYLLWSPLTETIKCNLAAEDNDAPPRQAFANYAKDFVDDKLADVVLYGGTYRKAAMRPSVQAALCVVTGGTASPDGKTCRQGAYQDPTVIVTHSMGGYRRMDAIDEELRNQDCSKVHGGSPAQKILENTQFIYMMANQLALLDLTTIRHYPRPPGAASPASSMSDQLAQRFAQCWTGAALKVRPASTPAGTEGNAQQEADASDRRFQRPERHTLLAPQARQPQTSAARVELGRADERLHVQQRIRHPAAVFRPSDRAHRLFRQSDRDGHGGVRDEQGVGRGVHPERRSALSIGRQHRPARDRPRIRSSTTGHP